MPTKSRKDYNGVISVHKPVPPDLLYHTSPGSVQQKSPAVERKRVRRRSASPKSTRVVTRPGPAADQAHTPSPCSIKQLQDQFLSERQEADAITQPLLDTEDGFIKDLEHFLNHADMLSLRKRELLHKRWTECVFQPVQRSVKQRIARRRYEGAETMKMKPTGQVDCNAKVSTGPLKDPLFLYSHSRMKEKNLILRCQTGCVDDRWWVASAEEQSRNKGDQNSGSRSRGPICISMADGRCFRPECWSSICLSHSVPVKS